MRRPLVALAIPLALLLAGCTEGLDPASATISYHGDKPGSEVDHFTCVEQHIGVQLTVTYKGDVGKSFHVALRTPSEAVVVNKTYDLPGPEEKSEASSHTEEPGVWTLTVTRNDPFKGNINVKATCA